MTHTAHVVTIERVVNSSANELYDAWTTPTVMSRWLARVVEADVRVGGSYRLEKRESDGRVIVFVGEYQCLDQGHHIVQTFSNAATKPGTVTDELLEVKFMPQGSLTRMTVIRSWRGPPMTAAEHARIEASWSAWLDKLCAGIELPSTMDA